MMIFHHNDMDGYASLYITARAALGQYPLITYDLSKFFRVNYESNVADKFALANNEDVYIVDYSFTKDTKYILDGLLERNCKVTWIDHHDSSIELEKLYPELKKIPGIRSKSMSGAGLCYVYFNMNNTPFDIDNLYEYDESSCTLCEDDMDHDRLYFMPRWVQYISDYDTWTHKFEESNYFKLGYDLCRHKIKLFDDLSINDVGTDIIIEKGKTIKEYIDNENSFYCKAYSYESELYDGTKCLVINKRSNSWIFGDKINDYPVCISAVFDGTEWQYTLFSNKDDVDCSKYAEKFGGGGHKGAAGFRSKELIFKKI